MHPERAKLAIRSFAGVLDLLGNDYGFILALLTPSGLVDTDVASMKKTSTRLATIGVVIVLGAFAIALAQHDSRTRGRDVPVTNTFASERAVPIPVRDTPSKRQSSTSPPGNLVMRANNDPPQPDNAAESEADDLSSFPGDAVVTAAGEGPARPAAGSPASITALPHWMDDEISAQPNGVSGTESGMTAASGETEALPSLPSFPMQATAGARESQQSAGSTGLENWPASPFDSSPSGAKSNASASMSDAPTPQSPPWNSPSIPGDGVSADHRDREELSPVQAGAMPPNNLSPPPRGDASLMNPPGTYEPGRAQAVSAPSTANPSSSPANSPSATRIQAPFSPTDASSLVSNQPGNRYLDGSQNPILQIHKRAPEEVQVGKKATFVISVRNDGNMAAHDVTVVDSVPRGVRFVDAMPATEPDAKGLLTWHLGELAAGETRTITLQLIPEAQGEIGSVASVYFAAQASVRTVATLPRLEIELQGEADSLIGEQRQYVVLVRNSGTGVARSVRLEADIPKQLVHTSGERQLGTDLGDLRPNQVERIPLDVSAVQAGEAEFAIRATSGDGDIAAEDSLVVQVHAPQLMASIEGPKLRYLERQATLRILVNNTGTAPASNLDFVARLPQGLKFTSTNNRGNYDPASHTVTWGLYEMPVGPLAEPIELSVLPVEAGPQVITFNATGDLNISAEAKWQMTVDGLAELAFTIGQDNGTIEVGASTTYSVQITNVGNKLDKDIKLVVQLPQGAELLAVDSQVEYRLEGAQLVFAPLAELRSKDQYTYRFQIRHQQPGTQIVRAQLSTANWPVAVTKEEGTLVYNDQN